MYALHAEAACGCKAGASLWIQAWFGDCVYTSWELTAFYIGLLSLMFWLVASVPQLINNWRLQSAEALSPWFLFQWLAGDAFNFLGCIFTGNQLATQNMSASYFIFADFIIISQYFYYQQPRKEEKEDLLCTREGDDKLKESASVTVYTPASLPTSLSGRVETEGVKDLINPITHVSGQSKGRQGHLAQFKRGERTPLLWKQAHDLESLQCQTPAADDFPSPSMSRQMRRVIMEYGLEYGPTNGPCLKIHRGPLRNRGVSKNIRLASAAVMGVAGLLCLGSASYNLGWGNQVALKSVGLAVERKLMTICGDSSRIWWLKDSGTTLGWASASLYLGSRISQVVKNNQRGSAEGLSLAMVSCAILANVTYGIAILMRLYSWQSFVEKAPWLVGSLGTVSLDALLLLQAHYLDYYSKSRRDKLNEYTPLLA